MENIIFLTFIIYRNNPKSIKNLGMKMKSIKTFKRNIKTRLYHFTLGKVFLNKSHLKEQIIKKKIGIFDYLTFLSFVKQKTP